MKAVYSVQCPFVGDPSTIDRAWDLVWEWLARFGVDRPTDTTSQGDGVAVGTANDSATWRILRDGEQEVRRLTHEQVQPETEEGRWVTHVWVVRDTKHVYGVVRSGPVNPEGVVTTLRFQAFRPRIVGDWIDQLHVVQDGRHLSTRAMNVGLNDADALVDHLLDPRRRLPIVGISTAYVDGQTKALISVNELASRLAGNAHVAVVHRPAAWQLTEKLGRPLSAFEGAVRIWWPRMTLSDDPYRHTLLLADRILANPDRARDHVVGRIWRAAVDAIGFPTLESRLLAAQSRRFIDDRVRVLRDEVADHGEWMEVLDEQLRLNEELEERIVAVEADNEDLRDALARVAVDSERDVDVLPEVGTVEEAVRTAAGESPHIVYLNSAYDSARDSQYVDPDQVLTDLRALERVAARWSAGDLPAGFRGAFAEEQVRFQPDISQTARTTYRSDYEIRYGGQTVMMGPHLRRGVGAPSAILRIYWYADEDAKQFVVGHVGPEAARRGEPELIGEVARHRPSLLPSLQLADTARTPADVPGQRAC
jgi:hypothetical protein